MSRTASTPRSMAVVSRSCGCIPTAQCPWHHFVRDQTEHRLRPRALGGRLMLPEADPHAAGGWARGDLLPARPGLPERRRGLRHPLLRAGQRPCGPCRPLLRRFPDYARGDGRPGLCPGLHRGARTRRDRNLAKPAAEVFRLGRLLPHRGRGWADLIKA
jgi:hypothetical protein